MCSKNLTFSQSIFIYLLLGIAALTDRIYQKGGGAVSEWSHLNREGDLPNPRMAACTFDFNFQVVICTYHCH